MSGIKWLLDTNMVIGLLKERHAAIELSKAQGLVLDRAAVSQITRMELLGFPGLTDEEAASTQSFLEACRVVVLDEAIEEQAIRLRRSGMFKLPDAIIAATALMLNAQLLTLDQGMSRALERVESGPEREAP